MLSPEHVGYASVCNSIGQSFGLFLANQVRFDGQRHLTKAYFVIGIHRTE